MRHLPIILACALILIGCDSRSDAPDAPQEKSPRRIVIGIVPRGLNSNYWQAIRAGAEAEATRQNAQLRWRVPPNDVERSQQLQTINDLLDQDVSAIAIAPMERGAFVETINKAFLHVPVVLFDSTVATDQYNAFVTLDNAKAGRAAAEQIRNLVGESGGEIAIVRTGSKSIEATEREERFKDEMIRWGKLPIVAEVFTDGNEAKAHKLVDQLLQDHPGLAGIFASDEANTMGALRALEDNIRAGQVKFVGFGTDDMLMRAVDSKSIDVLLVPDGAKIGALAVKAAADAVRAIPLDKNQRVEAAIITTANKSAMPDLIHPAPTTQPAQ